MEKIKNKKEICVDYHFHANLPKDDKKAEKHIKEYWKWLDESGIDVVLSTEHVYKNPKRAFEFLNKFKPENKVVIPGMEYVTKEGVDIIVFSKDEKIYDYSELKTFSMTLDKFLDFVATNEDLYTFVTHPYLKSKTGIVKNLGYKKFQEVLERVNALEVISGNALKQKLFKFYLLNLFSKSNFCFKQKINFPNKKFYISREDYDPKKISFIAVGSDAHQFGEVGNCLKLKYDGGDVFERLVNSKDGEIFVRPRRHNLKSLFLAPYIILNESWIKKKIKVKNLIKKIWK